MEQVSSSKSVRTPDEAFLNVDHRVTYVFFYDQNFSDVQVS
jgi:hypothetical protein